MTPQTHDSVRPLGPVLIMHGLTVRDGRGNALVHNMHLRLDPGERVGIVGESGSGKTITLRACLNLLPQLLSLQAEALRIAGFDLARLSEREQGNVRGTYLGFIPQNTDEYLHPLMRVGTQSIDGYRAHHPGVSRHQARELMGDLLARMGIEDTHRVLRSYPTQLSGGMRQRVKIAMAVMGKPVLVIADEPTAALDVLSQRKVADLLLEACKESGSALVVVSHSLDLVHELCDRLVVMHAGNIVEEGPAQEVYAHPGHPYTRALIGARPLVGMDRARPLREIGGVMPETGRDADVCLFASRCPLRDRACDRAPTAQVRDRHCVWCAHAWQESSEQKGLL